MAPELVDGGHPAGLTSLQHTGVVHATTGCDMLQVLRLGAPVTALSLSPAGDWLCPPLDHVPEC